MKRGAKQQQQQQVVRVSSGDVQGRAANAQKANSIVKSLQCLVFTVGGDGKAER